MQNNRANVGGLAVITRTFFAVIFGMWCHVVHATDMRYNPMAGAAQQVFNLHTFVLLDLFIICIAKYSESIYDAKIKQTLKSLAGNQDGGQEDLFGGALSKADSMLSFFDAVSSNSAVKQVSSVLSVGRNIWELVQDVFIFLFAMFFIDSFWKYQYSSKKLEMVIDLPWLDIHWRF